ncbi:MAG: FAD-dependent monooxygenase [Gammaproteobacteria bacterium]|nr:FAD-dependent monooxygenase [Gammaproteobacteria bacterium]
MPEQQEFDVVIVGAGAAGASAAYQYGKAGLKVALLEQLLAPSDYKKLCTHYLQPSVFPAIERMGLKQQFLDAGATLTRWRVYGDWGWMKMRQTAGEPSGYGLSLRREIMDPLLRTLATETNNVQFFPGHKVVEVVEENGRVNGVVTKTITGNRTFSGRLVVAADGRYSAIARAAKLEGKDSPNIHSIFFAYLENTDPPLLDTVPAWFALPEVATICPTDDNQIVAIYVNLTENLETFSDNLEENFLAVFDRLEGAPDLRSTKLVGPVRTMVNMHNTTRVAVQKGIALIGDAAMIIDPLSAAGVGWAFRSADLLTHLTTKALVNNEPLEPALDEYRKQHHKTFAAYQKLICHGSRSPKANPIQTLYMRAGVFDQQSANHMLSFIGQDISVRKLLAPSALLRALWVCFKNRKRIDQRKVFPSVPATAAPE